MPSDLRFLEELIPFLVERAVRFGIVSPEDTGLYVSLDEALVNAIKHGNKSDTSKIVRLRAEFSKREARFTIRDEGEGFDLAVIPDPRESANLLNPQGRRILFIHHFMDEVRYNERGNEITMIKFPEMPDRPGDVGAVDWKITLPVKQQTK